MGILQSASPAQTTKIIADQKAAMLEGQEEVVPGDPSALQSSLGAHIRNVFEQNVRVKNNGVTLRLLTCQRLRRGQYDAAEMADIKEQGGSDIFVNLTNIKCRSAESWINDVMFTNGEKAWTLDPTSIPDLPPDLSVAIAKQVGEEQASLLAEGVDVHANAYDDRLQDIRDELLQELRDLAAERVNNMEEKIEDILDEGGWDEALRSFINDFTTYPAAILKGPIDKKKRRLEWDDNGLPVIKDVIVKEFSRVSPFDIYPSGDSVDINDGPLVQRHRLFLTTLDAMKGVAGYKDDEIDAAMKAYASKGLVVTRAFDNERDVLEGRDSTGSWNRSTIEALQFWGPVQGKVLKEWAGHDAAKLKLDTLEDEKPYEIEGWLIGTHVIKAVINPDPFGIRPYFKASWDDIPGAWWGSCPAEIMADLQRMINACGRALANNMALASGPQVVVNIDRLPVGHTNIENIHPWKLWAVKGDRSGNGAKAVEFFQPQSNAEELQAVMDWYYKKSDEVTGIPNYTYGSAQVSGAGRTASGLSMLMDNASKGIKQAIGNIDNAVSRLITRMYLTILATDPDTTLRGDCRVVAKGTLGLIQREAVQQSRKEFLQATANPFDMQILGTNGRAALLRELAKGLQMDVNKIVPDPEALKAVIAKQEQMQQQGIDPNAPPGAAGAGAAAPPLGPTPMTDAAAAQR